jgi:hypothetical protein
MKAMTTAAMAGLLTLAVTTTAHAQRMDAEIDCTPTGEAYDHHCVIHLMEVPDEVPVEGAEFVVRAEMPSMPMAHNVPPAPAAASDGPGIYEVMLELEMLGAWALRLDITAPRRDVVVVVKDFGDPGDEPDDHDHGHDNDHD